MVDVVFVDANYWTAILNPRDALHARAKLLSQKYSKAKMVTTEMVLVEVFAHLSRYGTHIRSVVFALEKTLRSDPTVELIPQTRLQFREASAKYGQRLDKNWSLVDCASFIAMEQRGLIDALTHDEHFQQAGFRALLREETNN
jgi:predicted nucleic acid-binding protein